jgi:hypothetical protein
MGLKDITDVFNYLFIVGFFLPVFFLGVLIAGALTGALYGDSAGTALLEIGGGSLLVAIVLQGLNDPLLRMLRGGSHRRDVRPWIAAWFELLSRRAAARYDELQQQRDDATRSAAERSAAAQRLDRFWPPTREEIIAGRFGNAMRALEAYPYWRWGLDTTAVWARVETLLSEQEQQLLSAARAELNFFVNGAVLGFATSALLLAGSTPLAAWHGWPKADSWSTAGLVGAAGAVAVLAYMSYRLASGALVRYGDRVRAAIDLHRRELYAKLGLRTPVTFSEEHEYIAPSLNALLLYGILIPDDYAAAPRTTENP